MAGFNFLSNLLLIPPFGAAGAALTTLLSTVLGVLLLLRYSRGTLGLSLTPGPLLKMVVGGILTLLFISGLKWILRLPPWPEAFLVLIPSLLLYGLWLLATSSLTRGELQFLSRVFPLPKMRRAKE
jgi:peptidoglycan biosynthesis protein MviN/MurJ (putative lipid II flippase)